MSQSTAKTVSFNFKMKSASGSSASGAHYISQQQCHRILAIINEETAPTDTRSTFSGAADYDQTTPFNGVVGDAE